jgi:hypothetical protein
LRGALNLQSVALDDIRARLISLGQLMRESPPDVAKIHGALRNLVHVFEHLSNNAEAFMASLARTIELQRAEVAAVMSFKLLTPRQCDGLGHLPNSGPSAIGAASAGAN